MKTLALTLLPALGLALLLALTPVRAQDSPGGDTPAPEEAPAPENSLPEETRTLLREMLGRLTESMAGLVDILPRYGMPRLNEDGDIVIPRLDPPPENEKAAPQTEDTDKVPEDTREI